MLAPMEGHDRSAVVPHERAALADDHTVPPSAGSEVIRFDDRQNLAIVHDGPRRIVQAAAQVVSLKRGDARGFAGEQVREEVDVVNRVRLGDAHVGAWPLEARKPSGGVADLADESIPQRLV